MIRAYDDNGNVVDLVAWEKQIRADAKAQGIKEGKANIVKELLSIKNYCDDCCMEFCESCDHNGEYSYEIQEKLEQIRSANSEI